ncbi:MAG: hypothetical protein FJ224_05735 [Lentisphaerae bacterium]|nr:hypothetical protein [Lentisphaerota bacterium]
MRRSLSAVLVACMLAAGALTSSAGWVGVTAKAGTQGAGADLTLKLLPRLNLRAGVNYFDLDLDLSLDEANVQSSITWLTFPVLLDVHPFGGGFRLSGGVVFNNTKATLSAVPNETLELQNTDYEILGLDGKITLEPTGYYAGFGYGNAVSRNGRWHFACDFGVMYGDSLQASANATATDPLLQEALNADLDAEIRQFEKDTEGLVFYPVLSVGVSLAF